jgi:hypothetical protein
MVNVNSMGRHGTAFISVDQDYATGLVAQVITALLRVAEINHAWGITPHERGAGTSEDRGAAGKDALVFRARDLHRDCTRVIAPGTAPLPQEKVKGMASAAD